MKHGYCPIGRVSCDLCSYDTTAGCTAQRPLPTASSITREEILAHYDHRKEELMKLSKEELVEQLIGKRESLTMLFG